MTDRLGPAEIIELLELQPMATEAVMFRRTYASARMIAADRPLSTSIVALMTSAGDSFSDLHRLPADEIWHFHLGDPVEVLVLGDGVDEVVRLGPDLRAGDRLQHVVPAGVWMGARIVAGGSFAVFGCTMAPGYVITDFEGADPDDLVVRWPHREQMIRALTRTGVPRRFTEGPL